MKPEKNKINRAEYFIYKYADNLLVQIWSVAAPDVDEAFNLPRHGLNSEELQLLLFKLFESFNLVAHTDERGYFSPSFAEVVAATSEPNINGGHYNPSKETRYGYTSATKERFRALDQVFGGECQQKHQLRACGAGRSFLTPVMLALGIKKGASMKAHFQGIDHVMVTVGDLDVAREFYEGILGLEEMDCPVKDGQRVWYKIGNQQLHVNLQEEYHKAGFCHFAIAIKADKYHEYANSVSSTGYKLSCESKKFEDGIYRLFLDDPFSNTVEIHQAYRNA